MQILLDAAYPLSQNVIVPFPSSQTTRNAPDGAGKRMFNKIHSSTRMTIERTFGQLSGRWRFITKHLYMFGIEDICNVIAVACILHNFCISVQDPEFDMEAEDIVNAAENRDAGGAPLVEQTFSRGQARRSRIYEALIRR